MLTFIIYYLLLLKKLNDIFFQGYWLLHCYFIYYQIIGMEIVLNVGERNHLPVPSHFPRCRNYKPEIR